MEKSVSVSRRIGTIENRLSGVQTYEAYLATLTNEELTRHVWANLRELEEVLPRELWPEETRRLIDAVIIPREEK
jgi:hypothetical protein